MSKFQSTVSVVAALASIFGAGAAGWKLAQDDNKQSNVYEERINQLEKKLEESKQQSTESSPLQAIKLPQPTAQQVPPPSALPAPPIPPQPEPQPGTFE